MDKIKFNSIDGVEMAVRFQYIPATVTNVIVKTPNGRKLESISSGVIGTKAIVYRTEDKSTVLSVVIAKDPKERHNRVYARFYALKALTEKMDGTSASNMLLSYMASNMRKPPINASIVSGSPVSLRLAGAASA